MSDALSKMLESRDWIMADGATGTNLFNMGLESGDAPEFGTKPIPTASKSSIALPWTMARTCS